jgi:TonB family protein
LSGEIAMSSLEAEPKSSRRLWVLAGIAALVLHLGGAALAVAHLHSDDPDEDLGAPAIEVGLELTAPHVAPTDLPPGPDTEASVASAAMAEQKAEVQPTELPKDQPTVKEDADRQVSPNDQSKPREDDVKPAPVATSASAESAAVVATAMPSSDDVQEAPRSVAPAEGAGKNLQRVKATWVNKLVAHLDKHLIYPQERDNKAAKITLGLELDRLGHVVAASIVEGSGDPVFDQAALAMVKRSDPVPKPPPAVADEGLKFTLPVVFRKH